MRKRNYHWDDYKKFLELNELSCSDADEMVDGVLLDNYLFRLSRYTVFCYERYESSWGSYIEVLIIPNKHKNILKQEYDKWNKLVNIVRRSDDYVE